MTDVAVVTDVRRRPHVGLSAQTRVAAGFAVVLLGIAVAGVMAAARLPTPRTESLRLGWLPLTVLFTAAQAFVLHVQIRRETRSVFLSEIPLVLGLLYAAPVDLAVARIAGAVLASAVFRRQYRHPSKLLFNTCLAAGEVGVALTCYRELLYGGDPLQPRGWAAAVAGTVVANLLAWVAVALLIRMLDDTSPQRLVAMAVGSAVQAVLVATIGIVVATSLAQSRWAVVPLAAATGVLFMAFRAYAGLTERHMNLERLYEFTQVVATRPEVDDVLQRLLEQARTLLHAEQSRITFVLEAAEGGPVEIVMGANHTMRRGPAFYLAPDFGWLVDQVVERCEPVLVPRGAKDLASRHWLERCQLRESIMVPLPGENEVLGALAVDDRLGEARGFDEDDVKLLQAIANQASVALRNGRLLQRLRHDSLHDALTELPNRSFVQRELDQLLAAAPPQSFAVGLLDLDSFKDVNDTLGHQHGDELLREVSRRLAVAAGERVLVARLGGDEFAVVSRGCRDGAAAYRLGEALLGSLLEPIHVAGIEIPVTASLGFALSPQHGTTPAALLRHADMAMYAAKGSGKGIMLFDHSLDVSTPTKLAMATRLRQSVLSGALEVHYQPKADLRTGAVRGVEALVRWTDDELGPVPPDQFVPLAERSGLIRPLTQLVLARSIAACATWRHVAPGVGVAVNLSTRSLTDGELVDQVTRLLRRHDLPGELLTLEITESSIMADPARTIVLLEQLRALGVLVSVDDFGTGYSSLSYLRRLPVTEVKIDRSFVSGMATNAEDEAIVRSIIDLARNLGLSVVAEGVEDRVTWERLSQQGCTLAQGFHIAEPMPLADLPAWLAGREPAPPGRHLAAVVP